jgi:hypothetical protein
MEREWNGRRGEWDGRMWRVEREWDGGSGIWGLIEHADSLYYLPTYTDVYFRRRA